VWPGVEALDFRKLSVAESNSLTQPLNEDEVNAIWDCDSFKSLGSDGISFGFIKQFWGELKEDFQRFLTDFHHNR